MRICSHAHTLNTEHTADAFFNRAHLFDGVQLGQRQLQNVQVRTLDTGRHTARLRQLLLRLVDARGRWQLFFSNNTLCCRLRPLSLRCVVVAVYLSSEFTTRATLLFFVCALCFEWSDVAAGSRGTASVHNVQILHNTRAHTEAADLISYTN